MKTQLKGDKLESNKGKAKCIYFKALPRYPNKNPLRILSKNCIISFVCKPTSYYFPSSLSSIYTKTSKELTSATALI